MMRGGIGCGGEELREMENWRRRVLLTVVGREEEELNECSMTSSQEEEPPRLGCLGTSS